MSKKLSPESNISDLVDYLLDKGVDIHISVPEYPSSSLRILVGCVDEYDRPIICSKCIDMITYKSAVQELRNMVVTRTICELIEELNKLR